MVQDALQQATQELKSNPRLRYGVFAISFILLLYVCIVLSDMRTEVETEYLDTVENIESLSMIGGPLNWPKRAEIAKASLEQFQRKLWWAKNKGIAHALVLKWVEELGAKYKLKNPRIRVETLGNVSGFDDLLRVAAYIDARGAPKEFPKMMHEIETHDQAVAVARLHVSKGKPGSFHAEGMFQLVLHAYCMLGEEPPAPSPTPTPAPKQGLF